MAADLAPPGGEMRSLTGVDYFLIQSDPNNDSLLSAAALAQAELTNAGIGSHLFVEKFMSPLTERPLSQSHIIGMMTEISTEAEALVIVGGPNRDSRSLQPWKDSVKYMHTEHGLLAGGIQRLVIANPSYYGNLNFVQKPHKVYPGARMRHAKFGSFALDKNLADVFVS